MIKVLKSERVLPWEAGDHIGNWEGNAKVRSQWSTGFTPPELGSFKRLLTPPFGKGDICRLDSGPLHEPTNEAPRPDAFGTHCPGTCNAE